MYNDFDMTYKQIIQQWRLNTVFKKKKEKTPEGFLKKPTTQGFPPFGPLQQLNI